jgi:uncharacterized protein YcbK (DUF882 family)
MPEYGRRQFLKFAGTAALLLPCGGAFAAATKPRTLKFVHTHTGEKLSACYSANGHYQPECLLQVNRFLRDFRTGETHSIDPALLDVLYDLQVAANRDDTFEVISGYRSPRTNAKLRSQSSGVAEHSLHMDGQAIDVRLTGFPTKTLRDLAVSLRRGGVGFYASSDFVHVDTGRVRFW